MGPQLNSVPRKALQLVYDTAVKMLRQWDPDRLTGRDPEVVTALKKIREHFGLKETK